jgi:hypothetical protein
MDVLFFLLLGHFAGDYAFQSDNMAADKRISIKILSLHVLIYVITIWAFLFFYSVLYQAGLFWKNITLIFMAALYVQHWLQDYIKSRYKNGSKQMYYADQFMHLLVLYIYRIFIY